MPFVPDMVIVKPEFVAPEPIPPNAAVPVVVKTTSAPVKLYVVPVVEPKNPVVLVPPIIVIELFASVNVFVPVLFQPKVPQVIDLAFESNVPLASEIALLVPTVKASCNCHEPPTPLNVTGKSKVCALVVIVRTVALVEANVVALVPATKLMPDDSVRFP